MSGRHRKPHNRAPGRHRRPPGPARWLAPGLVAVALLGAGGVGAHAALSDSGSDSHGTLLPTTTMTLTPTATPTDAPGVAPSSAPSPAPSAAPSSSQAPSPAPQRAHHSAVFLRLAVTGSVSWIDVRRPDGHVLVSGMVRHGHRLTYRHGPLEVVIGNAGAVLLTRHGHTTRAGKPGEVLTFTAH